MTSPESLLTDQYQILDQLYDGLYVVNRERTIVYWNPAASRLTGFAPEEVVGRPCYDNLLNHVDAEGCGLCHGRCPLVASMGDGDVHEVLVYLRHRDGHRLPVEVRASPLRDPAGNVVGAVEVFQDGSHRELVLRRLGELERLAEIDSLTQVANRRLFQTTLQMKHEAFVAGLAPLAVLIVDVDRFKSINDTWGHPVGDRVLQEVAGTLAAAVRGDDLVARIGGEEFAVITHIEAPEGLTGLAERLGSLIRTTHPLLDDGGRLAVTASLGGAIARRGESAADLLARADRALYRSKNEGRDRFTLDRGVAVGAEVPPQVPPPPVLAAPRDLGATH